MKSPVKMGDGYVETGDGLVHFEGQVSTRQEASTYSTEYRPGSEIICTEDWSLWTLGFNGTTKQWLEVTI